MSETSKLEELNNSGSATEPALAVGTTVGTVAGLLTIIGYLFPGAMDERFMHITLVVVAFLLPIVTAIFTRGKVWSPASVKEVAKEAVEEAGKATQGIRKGNIPPKIL